MHILELRYEDNNGDAYFNSGWLNFMAYIAEMQDKNTGRPPLRHLIIDELEMYHAKIITTHYSTIRSISFETEEDKLAFVLKWAWHI